MLAGKPINSSIIGKESASASGLLTFELRTANLVKIVAVEEDVIIFSSKIGSETIQGVAKFRIIDEKVVSE